MIRLCSNFIAFVAVAFYFFFQVSPAAAQENVCGSPPSVDDVRLRGEIQGKAQALTSYIGDATLKGQVDFARQDVLSRYPNADRLRLNQYFLYVVCVAIMRDGQMSTEAKLSELRRARQSIDPTPPRRSRVRIETGGMWIGNAEIGDVHASSSKIEFHIDGEYETDMSLSEPFPGIDMTLEDGAHTFTYKVDVRAKSGLRVRASCSAIFVVKGQQIFNPSITFEPYDSNRGRISRCSLRPSS